MFVMILFSMSKVGDTTISSIKALAHQCVESKEHHVYYDIISSNKALATYPSMWNMKTNYA